MVCEPHQQTQGKGEMGTQETCRSGSGAAAPVMSSEKWPKPGSQVDKRLEGGQMGESHGDMERQINT